MNNSNVGARILNIVTESLYDKPIVVFREYVQNTVDAFRSLLPEVDKNLLKSEIWYSDSNLFFLDNGTGIKEESFLDKMTALALSDKNKTDNLGYKGIGRFSGLPYCHKLQFVNIISFAEAKFQLYSIDGETYNKLIRDDTYISETNFETFLDHISTYSDTPDPQLRNEIVNALNPYQDMFKNRDTGFLVSLYGLNIVLRSSVELEKNPNLIDDLSWLLPVPYKKELLDPDYNNSDIFKELSTPDQGFNISYNGQTLLRPITKNLLRKNVCMKEFTNATCFFSFTEEGIQIDKKRLTGIRLYLNNMLLCDETEIIPAIYKFGLLNRSETDLMQTVKGLGIVIYITNNKAISANARRTFIEVNDQDSLDFLEELSIFINQIYRSRYAISNYKSAIKKDQAAGEQISTLRTKLVDSLNDLVNDKIEFSIEDSDLEDLSIDEKRSIIRKRLTRYMSKFYSEYLDNLTDFDDDHPEETFIQWLKATK